MASLGSGLDLVIGRRLVVVCVVLIGRHRFRDQRVNGDGSDIDTYVPMEFRQLTFN
jgi:hypothetical protein